jgi:hypothetical protein
MPSSSPAEAYRLWQLWQQMHYPTPLPSTSELGIDLVALDGKAGTSLERYFERPRRRVLDDDCRAALEECMAELELAVASLQGHPARYFRRLHRLVRLILDAAPERVIASSGGEPAVPIIN